MTRARRAAYFAAAPLVCLALFWRVLFTWFLNDDFAWLGLRLEIHSARDLWDALFSPQAQGTVRVLSERVFFLVFSSLFGLNAVPLRIWVLATWFVDLGLAAAIGARLTGSRAAGLAAAVLWAVNVNMTAPLARAAYYNEVLIALFFLCAFYARLRRWRIAEWAAYLLGFGALEIMVMYPAIALLHAACMDRKRIRETFPLFVPAAVFSALHLFLIPKTPGGFYEVIVDARLPATFWRYLAWTIVPHPSLLPGRWSTFAPLAGIAIGVALAWFIAARFRQRDWRPVFFCGWFVLMLAPVLPLPNHISDYYLVTPMAGLAWLAGWAIVSGFQAGWAPRAAAILLAAAYCAGSAEAAGIASRWYLDRSERLENVVLGIRQLARPGAPVLLRGVDNDLFGSGFEDNPFVLIGAGKVYLVPGGEQIIHARADLGGIARWAISPRGALGLIEHGGASVLDIRPEGVRDITRSYAAILRADPRSSRIDFVDAGDPQYAAQLGGQWHQPENGFRWMGRTATVTLSAPADPSEKLYVTGYAPGVLFASGPVRIRFTAAGKEIGSANPKPDERFSLEFPLPPPQAASVEITISVNKVVHVPPDPRDLGMTFGSFAIR